MGIGGDSFRAKLKELSKRVEKLEQRFGIEPKSFLESLEERIEKLEKS